MSALFEGFKAGTEEDWRAGIIRELKGKPYESLLQDWGHAQLEPFYTRAPEGMQYLGRAEGNSWAIGASFELAEGNEINAELLRCLREGVEAIELRLGENRPDYRRLLKGIEPDFIQLHLSFSSYASALGGIKPFFEYMLERGIPGSGLSGSLAAGLGEEPAQDQLIALLDWNAHLPAFRLFTIEAGHSGGHPQALIQELARMARQTEQLITRLVKRNVPLETIASLLQYRLPLGVHYLAEIARIRALRLLIGNVWRQFGYPILPEQVCILADTAGAAGDDPNTHRIRVTTQAMSAVIGGVSALFVKPGQESSQDGEGFSRRMATNLQHILKYESFMDRVADPSAGSYSIEQMTLSLAEQAWTLFREGRSIVELLRNVNE